MKVYGQSDLTFVQYGCVMMLLRIAEFEWAAPDGPTGKRGAERACESQCCQCFHAAHADKLEAIVTFRPATEASLQ